MSDTRIPASVPAAACKPKAPIPADKFENPTAFQKAVGIGFDNLKKDTECETSAKTILASTDSTTSRTLQEATAARNAKNSEATKPVIAAQQALANKQAELRAPITQISSSLASAEDALDRTTFPNKRELNARRAEAHGRVDNMTRVLDQARQTLSRFDGQTREMETKIQVLSGQQSRYASDLSNLESQLRQAQNTSRQAEFNRPSDRDIQSATDSHRSAESRYSAAVAALREYDNRPTPPSPDRPTPPSPDRPTPPSPGGRPTPPSPDRPTPPSVGGRPTPPSPGGSTRPTPPSPTGGSGGSRAELEADVSAARSRLNETRSRLDNVDARVSDANNKYQTVRTLEGRVNEYEAALASTISGLQNTTYEKREHLRQRPGLEEQVRSGEQLVAASRQEAARLDNTPYDRGDEAAIKTAQTKVNGLKQQLAKANADYKAGTAPFEATLASAQATYDAIMAPFEKAVQDATNGRQSALQQANGQTSAAAQRLAQSKKDLHDLKEDSPGIKWSAPKWLGGWGFSTKDFWKKQPAVD